MAIPTITNITPSSGSTKGDNIIIINGTNFRLPDAPPAKGPTTGIRIPSVKVYFEGVESDYSEAANETTIYCRVPRWNGSYKNLPMDLDVRVENVDSSGTLIPGEFVTESGGYRIERSNLAVESSVQGYMREMIKVLRRHFLQNTHLSMSRDYSELSAQYSREKPDLPVCYLIRPRMSRNSLGTEHRVECEEVSSPDDFIRKKPPVVADISIEIVVLSDSQSALTSLEQSLLLFFRDVTDITFNGNVFEFRMPFNDFPNATVLPNLDDVYSFRSGAVIKQVHIDDIDGTIIERGWRVTDNDGEPIVDIQDDII